MATLMQAPVATRDGRTTSGIDSRAADDQAALPSAGGAAPAAAPGDSTTGRHADIAAVHSATGQAAGDGRQATPTQSTVSGMANGVAGLRDRLATRAGQRRSRPTQGSAAVVATGHADWASDVATLAIVVTAGVASWAGWVYLAEAVGWGSWPVPGLGFVFHLSWLLPLSVDVYAFIAARAWLGRGLDADTRRWGRNSAWAALGLSMAGNAGGHGVEAEVWSPGWIVVVAVAMVPPVMLFLALHLRTMRTRDREALATREASRQARRVANGQPGHGQGGHTATASTNAAGQSGVASTKTTPAASTALATGTAAASRVAERASGDTADRVRAAFEDAVATGQTDELSASDLATQISGQVGASPRTVRRHLTPLRRQLANGHTEGGDQ